MKKELMEFKIEPKDIKRRVHASLSADPPERKLYMKRRALKTALIAAAITVIASAVAFAASPAGQEAISSIMAYFQNEQSKEITSLEELAKFNEEIGASVTKDGITLTLDNVAADDNFVHVFYTVTSDAPFYEGDDQYSNEVWDKLLWTECVINGNVAGFGNNNSSDGYFADEHTYKAMRKYNVSTEGIPDNFKVELFGETNSSFKTALPDDSPFNLIWKDIASEITDEQKASVWYVCADVDKSAAEVETASRDIGVTLDSGIILDKAVFSPFGNQIIVRTEAGGDSDEDSSDYLLRAVDDFALFDENGTCLDMLNAGASMAADGSSLNSFEFLKADVNTKKLKIVPTHYVEPESDKRAAKTTVKLADITYPFAVESEHGKTVVTGVRVYDGRVEVDYYIDGYVKYGPYFELLNDDGESAEPGGKLGCLLNTEVHHDTNSYTDVFSYDAHDDNGNRIPMDDSVSAEAIKRNFTTLEITTVNGYVLDEDKAVTVELK